MYRSNEIVLGKENVITENIDKLSMKVRKIK